MEKQKQEKQEKPNAFEEKDKIIKKQKRTITITTIKMRCTITVTKANEIATRRRRNRCEWWDQWSHISVALWGRFSTESKMMSRLFAVLLCVILTFIIIAVGPLCCCACGEGRHLQCACCVLAKISPESRGELSADVCLPMPLYLHVPSEYSKKG